MIWDPKFHDPIPVLDDRSAERVDCGTAFDRGGAIRRWLLDIAAIFACGICVGAMSLKWWLHL